MSRALLFILMARLGLVFEAIVEVNYTPYVLPMPISYLGIGVIRAESLGQN
jgi:hypothetical protein